MISIVLNYLKKFLFFCFCFGEWWNLIPRSVQCLWFHCNQTSRLFTRFAVSNSTLLSTRTICVFIYSKCFKSWNHSWKGRISEGTLFHGKISHHPLAINKTYTKVETWLRFHKKYFHHQLCTDIFWSDKGPLKWTGHLRAVPFQWKSGERGIT